MPVLFSDAWRLGHRKIMKRRSAWRYLFRKRRKDIGLPRDTVVESSKSSKAPNFVYQSSAFFRLPGEIRNEIYTYVCYGADMERTLQAIQFDRLNRLAASGLMGSCRQIYHELRGILADKRVFTVTGFKQHCVQHSHYRDRFNNALAEFRGFKYHSYSEELDRNGNVINDSGSNKPSVHGTRETSWYTMERCGRCERSGHKILSMSKQQLASVKRLVLPCCLCNIRSHSINGVDVTNLTPGWYLDYSGVGLDPEELILQICVCKTLSTNWTPGYGDIGKLGLYIRSISDHFGRMKECANLKRIVVYHCDDPSARKRRQQRPDDFAAAVVCYSSDNDKLHWSRCDKTTNEATGVGHFTIPDEHAQSAELGGHVSFERIINGRKIALDFYESVSVSGKTCVFDSAFPFKDPVHDPAMLQSSIDRDPDVFGLYSRRSLDALTGDKQNQTWNRSAWRKDTMTNKWVNSNAAATLSARGNK